MAKQATNCFCGSMLFGRGSM
ncbi:unnamed protein product [Linum tenue]|uniref:Uncharacterized protein n=1 Tax=Linum tenue TaxID=586396 RepID=A0AAV0MAV6_9ROSI|nr:unnamed protein product [Linum tenue]